jgi:Na+-transporting methylmalonyl-CoA/oxaloacetate decarboxylase gamma subunit
MEDLAFWAWTTVVGMGIVFLILALVWLLLTLLMRIDDRRARARVPAGLPPATVPGKPASAAPPTVRLLGAPANLDPRLLAAITIAIVRHEEARRLQAAPAMRSYWPGSLLFASRWVAAGRTRQGQTWRRRR